MKKTIAGVLTAFILAGALTGCQATPEQPIVIRKDLDSIVDSATNAEKASTELSQPETLTDEFESIKGNVKFFVDASITVPETESIPVARVARAGMTEEDVKHFYESLCSGTSVRVGEYTAPYYLGLIDRYSGSETAEKDVKMYGEEGGSYISELQAAAASAPDSYTPAEPDFSFKQDDYFEKAEVWSLGENGAVSQVLFRRIDGNDTGAYVRDMLLTEKLDKTPASSSEDAKELAADTVQSLGFSDFVCGCERLARLSDIDILSVDEGGEQNRDLYEFTFTRSINGVPITCTFNDGLTVEHDSAAKPWMYEKLKVFVDDGGVFSVLWCSPYELCETVTESSAIKPFDEIQPIIEKMLPILCEYKDSDSQYSYEINISDIRLGLMRVTEKDVGDKGLVIPVWDVFGTETLTAKTDPSLPMNNMVDDTGLLIPYITVNAIDGSIIDRDLGY